MALFQPTNIIPSSFTEGVVDPDKDIAQVSWQVNGNSAMTAYQIDFYTSNGTSLSGGGTGKITDGIPEGGFYGTDRFGQPKIFTWTNQDKKTWHEYRTAIVADRTYQIKITQWYEGGDASGMQQIEAVVFATRTTPQLNIQRSSNAEFIDPKPFPEGSTLPASIGYFVGAYTQAQGAPVREVRWQVATWVNGGLGEILADTGNVDTPTLQYSFDGFFIGNQYAIRCSGKADYQTYGTQDFDSEWVYFTAQLNEEQQQGEYNGEFTVQCLPNENASLLEWESVEFIPPTFQPQDFNPDATNGMVLIPAANSVTWKDKVIISNGDEEHTPINFATPWTAAIKIKPLKGETSQNETVSGTAMTSVRSYTKTLQATNIEWQSIGSSSPNMWTAQITIKPESPYARVDLIANTPIETLGGSLQGYKQTEAGDGAINVQIIVNNKPTRTLIYIYYTGYTYTKSVTCKYDILRYTVQQTGDTTIKCDISTNDSQHLSVVIYGKTLGGSVSAKILIYLQTFVTQGKFFELGGSGVNLVLQENNLQLRNGEEVIQSLELHTSSTSVVAVLTPNTLKTFNFKGTSLYATQIKSIAYQQAPIKSVTVSGATGGLTLENVAVYQGDAANVLDLYENSEFKPVWNTTSYSLYLAANIIGNLEGGTGTSTGAGFRIYRQEVGSNVLTPIATVPSTTTAVKDYGIRSRKSYKYSLFVYDSNQTFMLNVDNDTVVATNFKNYSLLVCDYDSTNDTYHVRKQYIFALNLSEGSVGNNNSPILNANFTAYPTRMPSTQNYVSGTLQGLIGVIYTVPALIEQIGGIKHTAKPSTLDYIDSVDLEKELYDLSIAPYQLFLRDMKGHLRMVSTNGAISMTTNLKQKQQSISISLPWVEIGDASDVSIIQTPDDYGWNNDDQVLDVNLDVDPLSGVLSAYYPKPYNGTKFYLTGINREVLSAKTPVGVKPAEFDLSVKATEPSDGILTAAAKVNSKEE